ncbi:MAG: ABC transporter substrate-binding protein [Lentisphaerae bacterium]|nr:ABC transporter substrate-binding protein [Lentisphaerota bacterium]
MKCMKMLTASALMSGICSVGIAGEIKVGVNLALSGNLASYGKATLDGIKLKADEINAAGGIGGDKIVLIIEDNKGDQTETKNAYKKLASSDKVVTVIGPITSTNAIAVRRDAAELKVPVISPTATNDKVTLRNPYMFRTCFNDSFQGRIAANFAIKEKGYKTASILVDMNSDYSKGLSENFKKAFESAGGKIITQEGYQQKDTEFGVQLKKIKESAAQTVFVPGYPPEVPLIIKQAKVIGLDARLCGADGWDNEAVINGSGNNIEGCFIVGAFSREDKRDAVRNFVVSFEKTFNDKPGTFEALGYDSISILAEALKKGTTPEAVKDGLHAIKDFEAVTGKTTVTPDGDVEKNAVILEITREGDKYVAKYKATVNP